MDDELLLRSAYKVYLTELKVPFSKREETQEYENKLFKAIYPLSKSKIEILSQPLQNYIYSLDLASVKKKVLTDEDVKTIIQYGNVDPYGFVVGSRRSYAAKVLSESGWIKRSDIVEKGKKIFPTFSIHSVDKCETILRKRGYNIKTETKDTGDVYIKLEE